MLTRRTLLQKTALATSASTVAACLPGRVLAQRTPAILVPPAGKWSDPDLHALAQHAVDAARSAGASYADVRITTDREEAFDDMSPRVDQERKAVGVRVLVNGFWGFMGSAVWTADEMARLARGAVAQAKATALGATREVDLGHVVPVVKGNWRMPVKYDPFDIPKGEKFDIWNSMMQSVHSYKTDINSSGKLQFTRQHKIFASSEGSTWEQTTYSTSAFVLIQVPGQYSRQTEQAMFYPLLFTPAGKGWEHISESGFVEQIPQFVDEAEQMRYRTPVQVGRYDTVFSAQAMASIVDTTIGAATELDRALAFGANAEGTSYLNEPLEMVGTQRIGNSLVNVEANRSVAGGLATVAWDDESVKPETFALVKDGVLADFQTTREQSAWLAPYYKSRNIPVRSHGCASAESAMFITTLHTPNLRLVPNPQGGTFDDMVQDTKKGIAVVAMNLIMDHQQLNGFSIPIMREITNGKLGSYIDNGAVAFRAPEFWKDCVALGGAATEAMYGFYRSRGQPVQGTMHSVAAVPGKIKNMRIIDALGGKGA